MGSTSTRVDDRVHHLVKLSLLTGEGEGETQGKDSPFHSHVLQEVRNALDDMVEELGRQIQMSTRTHARTHTLSRFMLGSNPFHK